eukprot:3260242-Pyramimonas_sp.AAC.1
MDAMKEAMYGVFDAAEQLVLKSELKGILAMVRCNKGCHRSDTNGRALKECLNCVLNGEHGK